jgi:hypothetical protein
VRAPAPEGWSEIFGGPCVRANVIHAVLEASGLRPVTQQFSPDVWWSGQVLEDCRVYVPEDQAEAARRVLDEGEAEDEVGG